MHHMLSNCDLLFCASHGVPLDVDDYLTGTVNLIITDFENTLPLEAEMNRNLTCLPAGMVCHPP